MTLIRKDFASLRKFFTWLIQHLEYEDKQATNDDPAILALVPALQQIFFRFHEYNSKKVKQDD
jgi:hypothetical protein